MTKMPPRTARPSNAWIATAPVRCFFTSAFALSISAGSALGQDLSAPTPIQVGGKVVEAETPGLASPGWFDVTGDGKPDLVVGQHAGGALIVYPASGKRLAKARPMKAKRKPVQIPGVGETPADFGASVHLADINGDRRPDLICGSYMDIHGGTAEGHMYCLMAKGRKFEKPIILNGNAGKPLSMGSGPATPLANVASVPTTVDLDGDGHLDIVSGNYEGHFYLFKGLDKGSFEQQPTKLMGPAAPLKVAIQSSPTFVDWDGDGDQDLLSGSGVGGVYLFVNTGSPKAPTFAEAVTLVATPPFSPIPPLGIAKVPGPGTCTRVWAGDRNGDGKPDLLVGDKTTIAVPAPGASDAQAIEAYEEFQAALIEFGKTAGRPLVDPGALEEWDDNVKALEAKRDKVVKKVETGLVWEIFQQ